MPLKRSFLKDRQLNVCTNDWFNPVNLWLLTECISTLVELTRWIFSSTFYPVTLVLCNKVAFVTKLVALASLSLGKIVDFMPSRDCWVPGKSSSIAPLIILRWGWSWEERKGRPLLGLMSGAGAVDQAEIWGGSWGKWNLWRLIWREGSHWLSRVLPFSSFRWKEQLLCLGLSIKGTWLGSSPMGHFREKPWLVLWPKGSRFSLWDFKDTVWSGHGCDWSWKGLSTQFLALWCASVESTVSLAVCQLTRPSWLQDSERDGAASPLHRNKFCSESMFV